jgi:hypothetical protein
MQAGGFARNVLRGRASAALFRSGFNARGPAPQLLSNTQNHFRSLIQDLI